MHTAETRCHVNVLDVNEFAPRFDRPYYKAVVAQDAPIGVSIAQISASDDDGTPVSYNLYDIEAAIKVDQSSGIVTTTRSMGPGLRWLTVEARDLGKPSMASRTLLLLHVASVTAATEQMRPQFKQTIYEVQIDENIAPHTIIQQLATITNTTNMLEYSIQSGDIQR